MLLVETSELAKILSKYSHRFFDPKYPSICSQNIRTLKQIIMYMSESLPFEKFYDEIEKNDTDVDYKQLIKLLNNEYLCNKYICCLLNVDSYIIKDIYKSMGIPEKYYTKDLISYARKGSILLYDSLYHVAYRETTVLHVTDINNIKEDFIAKLSKNELNRLKYYFQIKSDKTSFFNDKYVIFEYIIPSNFINDIIKNFSIKIEQDIATHILLPFKRYLKYDEFIEWSRIANLEASLNINGIKDNYIDLVYVNYCRILSQYAEFHTPFYKEKQKFKEVLNEEPKTS